MFICFCNLKLIIVLIPNGSHHHIQFIGNFKLNISCASMHMTEIQSNLIIHSYLFLFLISFYCNLDFILLRLLVPGASQGTKKWGSYHERKSLPKCGGESGDAAQ